MTWEENTSIWSEKLNKRRGKNIKEFFKIKMRSDEVSPQPPQW